MTNLDHLLGQMTLDEKLAQLVSFWGHQLQEGPAFSGEKAARLIKSGAGQISRSAGGSSLEPYSVAVFNNSLQRFLREQTRLKIPAIAMKSVVQVTWDWVAAYFHRCWDWPARLSQTLPAG